LNQVSALAPFPGVALAETTPAQTMHVQFTNTNY